MSVYEYGGEIVRSPILALFHLFHAWCAFNASFVVIGTTKIMCVHYIRCRWCRAIGPKIPTAVCGWATSRRTWRRYRVYIMSGCGNGILETSYTYERCHESFSIITFTSTLINYYIRTWTRTWWPLTWWWKQPGCTTLYSATKKEDGYNWL
jgi:hypothetical protein